MLFYIYWVVFESYFFVIEIGEVCKFKLLVDDFLVYEDEFCECFLKLFEEIYDDKEEFI